MDREGHQFQVALIADPEHTRDYVAEMLADLFFMEETDAQWLAEEVFLVGRAVVLVCDWSAAQFAKRQIENHGPDPRIETSRGSMTAMVEPAESVQDFV